MRRQPYFFSVDLVNYLGFVTLYGMDTADLIAKLAARGGVFRSRDLAGIGVGRHRLRALVDAGHLERIGRGLYAASASWPTEHRDLVEVAARVPHGVICLLSALRFHEIGTQDPKAVWLAIANKAWRPRDEGVALQVVRFSPEALRDGVAEHRLEGRPVRITTPARTVADCFKFRRRVGLDVALEALRDCWRERRCTPDELMAAARTCRVTGIVGPSLDAIVASA